MNVESPSFEEREDLRMLVDSAKPIIEVFKAESTVQKKWKKDWLYLANKWVNDEGVKK